MKSLNSFSRFMAEVTERASILRTPNPVILSLSKGRTPVFHRIPIHMVVILALMLIAALVPTPQAHAQVMPGDILAIDENAGTDLSGALFRVNPATGSRTVVSDFGNSAQGPLGVNPTGVALDASGSILVIDPFAGTNGRGALFAVNPSGGNRIVVSDFGDPSKGIVGVFPVGVTAFTVKCGGLDATMIGTPGDDVINGTSLADVIVGLGGKDTINGLGGSVDFICGGLGDDTLSGGEGNDRLFGDAGLDRLDGGTGADTCNGDTQNDTSTVCETRTNIP